MSDEVPHQDAASDVVVWAEDGRLLLAGEPAAVDSFLDTIDAPRRLDVAALKGAADGLAALSAAHGIRTTGACYVQLSAESAVKLARYGAQSDGAGGIYGFVRNASGQFAGNLRLKPVALAGTRALSVQVTMAVAAIRFALQETQDAVEEVAADVGELCQLAEAAEIGNVAGLYRVLANARTQADETGSISQATWDAIAVHEVTAQQGADRARALVRRMLRDLPLDGDTVERAAAAERLVRERALARSLQLLLLAEQCRLLYRSLKLDQVRRTEPEALDGEVTAAQRLLGENAAADRDLIDQLHDSVSRLGRTGPLDGVRLLTRGRLPRLAAVLQEQVEEFAQQRQQQLDSWASSTAHTVRDAVLEVAGRAYRGVIEGRNLLGGFVEQVGRRLQGVERDRDRDRPADTDSSDDR